jgi:hypothetical protein
VLYDYHEIALYANDLILWIALSGWILSRLLNRRRTGLRWGPVFLYAPLLGLVILGIMGIPKAVDPTYAAYTTARLVLLFAFCLMLVNAPLKQSLIAWPLAIGMAIQAAVGIPQFLLGHTLGLQWLGETAASAALPGASVVMVGELRWLRAYGLTQHPNVLGGLLVGCLWAVTGYYLTRRGWARIALLVLLAMGLGTLLLTFSRAAWLGIVAGGVVLGGLLLWARQGGLALPRSALIFL